MDTIESNASAPAAPVESAPTQEVQSTEAPLATGEGDSPEQKPPEEKKPEAPSRLQKRIDELTRQRYEEQRRAEAAEQRAQQYERQQALTHQFSQLDAAMPNVEQFSNLQEYGRALADWSARRAAAVATAQWQEFSERQASYQAQQARQIFEQQQRVQHENSALEKKMEAGMKKYPDFMQVVTSDDIGSVRSTPLFPLILEADNAHDIAYALAKNPVEIDRLLSLGNPAAMARAIFQMDRQFSGNAVTTAPPPPPTRNGSSAPSGQPDPRNTEAWMKWREAELAKSGRRR